MLKVYKVKKYVALLLFQVVILLIMLNNNLDPCHFDCLREKDEEKEYLVKWRDLQYDECYWESHSDISSFQTEIDNFNRLQSRRRKAGSSKQKSGLREATELKKKQKEFEQYDKSPEFLTGGLDYFD